MPAPAALPRRLLNRTLAGPNSRSGRFRRAQSPVSPSRPSVAVQDKHNRLAAYHKNTAHSTQRHACCRHYTDKQCSCIRTLHIPLPTSINTRRPDADQNCGAQTGHVTYLTDTGHIRTNSMAQLFRANSSLHSMEPECSLQSPKQPATCPYPEPDQSSPRPSILFL